MGETSRVGISASKVVALIGTLFLLWESYVAILFQELVPVLLGILGIVLAIILFISLNIFETTRVNIPYEPWVPLIIGIIIALLFYYNLRVYLGGSLIIISGILEVLSEKQKYSSSKVVAVIGAFWAIICEGILNGILTGAAVAIFWGVIKIALGVILLLTMQTKINIHIPYSWWVVLIIGFIIFMFPIGFGSYAGIIILVAFILMLMAY
ncbi:MAG: hypothetical protein ACFFBP_16085 [Promethearchaeota archaeon]